MNAIVNRFFRYIKINTKSDPMNSSCPSTPGQMNLAKVLLDELKDFGLADATMTKHGYVHATLPSNVKHDVPVIGFLAHMDTSPDFSGHGVNPKIISDYQGGDIVLNSDLDIILKDSEFPELKELIGLDLIVTDGTTLLGADDKAGIAEIMEAIKYLVENPDSKHGTIKIAFTPDEEIGRGADLFPVEEFGADFAYTLDGGPLGELEYENFNAASVKLSINGRNVHPGTAKNKMINAIQTGIDLHNRLPLLDRPEKTEAYEGFFHLYSFSGHVDQVNMSYIIRDHDRKLFEEKKELIIREVNHINQLFGKNIIEYEMKDQYYNMREKIVPVMHIVELARMAMLDLNIQPLIKPIRGGTDGSKLSFKGLPTPNLFTGGYNFHGRFEFIPIQSMTKARDLILRIISRSVN